MILGLKKIVSALSNITIYDLHFALVHLETNILRKFQKQTKFEYLCRDFMIRMYV